eukprot:4776219-Pleurochrysis_carterae.AAC.1
MSRLCLHLKDTCPISPSLSWPQVPWARTTRTCLPAPTPTGQRSPRGARSTARRQAHEDAREQRAVAGQPHEMRAHAHAPPPLPTLGSSLPVPLISSPSDIHIALPYSYLHPRSRPLPPPLSP